MQLQEHAGAGSFRIENVPLFLTLTLEKNPLNTPKFNIAHTYPPTGAVPGKEFSGPWGWSHIKGGMGEGAATPGGGAWAGSSLLLPSPSLPPFPPPLDGLGSNQAVPQTSQPSTLSRESSSLRGEPTQGWPREESFPIPEAKCWDQGAGWIWANIGVPAGEQMGSSFPVEGRQWSGGGVVTGDLCFVSVDM